MESDPPRAHALTCHPLALSLSLSLPSFFLVAPPTPAYREPIVYNLAVAREVAKQVYISEKLAPPTNLQDIRGAYEEFYNKASDASWWRSVLESGAWKKLAIYALEAYGIFTIGEMIGRR